MFWLRNQGDRIHPTLDSIGPGYSQHQQRADAQVELELQKTNWKFVGSIASSILFIVLSSITVVAVPIALAKLKRSDCSTTSNEITDDMTRLCAANATWDPQGVTVAGFTDGSPSITLMGLQLPNDAHVFSDGTILVVDSNNNRITLWKPNATIGELVVGTGSMGSWSNLLSRPVALAVRNGAIIVSDADNYRIQMFPLNSSQSSPDGITIMGDFGEGFNINQVEEITSIVAPISIPSLLYLADSRNHRILLWNAQTRMAEVVAGVSNLPGSDSILLYNPTGIALDERANVLYVADKLNNRIQKYDMQIPNATVTVAGWGQLNNPYSIQLEPFGNNMFIVDTFNHRVLLWLNDATTGRTIAGTGAPGSSATQLNKPVQVRLDRKHNLYVVDMNNNRIQRFNLISNGC